MAAAGGAMPCAAGGTVAVALPRVTRGSRQGVVVETSLAIDYSGRGVVTRTSVCLESGNTNVVAGSAIVLTGRSVNATDGTYAMSRLAVASDDEAVRTTGRAIATPGRTVTAAERALAMTGRNSALNGNTVSTFGVANNITMVGARSAVVRIDAGGSQMIGSRNDLAIIGSGRTIAAATTTVAVSTYPQRRS